MKSQIDAGKKYNEVSHCVEKTSYKLVQTQIKGSEFKLRGQSPFVDKEIKGTLPFYFTKPQPVRILRISKVGI